MPESHAVSPPKLGIKGLHSPFCAALATGNSMRHGVGTPALYAIVTSVIASPDWKVDLPPVMSLQLGATECVYIRGTECLVETAGNDHSSIQPINSSTHQLSLYQHRSSIVLQHEALTSPRPSASGSCPSCASHRSPCWHSHPRKVHCQAQEPEP